MSSRVLPFPSPTQDGIPSTRWNRLFLRAQLWIGALAKRHHIPGIVQPVLVEDEVTGQRLAISVGPLLTCISVDGRDYYFDRFTGRFDGTGSGCASPLSRCTVGSNAR